MEVVEIREGNINIESEEEEDETDDPQHSEGHLVFVSGCSLTKQKKLQVYREIFSGRKGPGAGRDCWSPGDT